MTASDGGNPLAPWCRALEVRLQETLNSKLELDRENRRLRARVRELTAIIQGIQQAYLIGKMRSAGQVPDLEPITGPARKPDTSSIRLPEDTPAGGDTRVEPEGADPSASWAYPPED